MIIDVDSATVAALSVVAVAFLFGVLAAPYGLALELPPVTVALAVFAGTAGFACVMVPAVMDLVPEAAGRRARWALLVAPRVARIWRLAGRTATGARTALLVDRSSAVVQRWGIRPVALLAPVVGRWLVPVAGIALGTDRRRLIGWAVAGCAVWAAVLTAAFDLLLGLFG